MTSNHHPKEPIPADIDQIATDIVRTDYSKSDLEPDWLLYAAISNAIRTERDRCAAIAEKYSIMAHAAFDMKSKSFPTKSPIQDFIAKQIRGEE